MIRGQATAEGTERFRKRFEGATAEGHFRRVGKLWLSSIGLGTYLGDADDATDDAYEEAILVALERGCNVFDTAINYRNQRSERALGRALARAFDRGPARRDEVFVSTKAGFLPFDGDAPADPEANVRQTFLEPGILEQEDIAGGCHAIRPTFLADQIARSRTNLGLESLDLFYLHNPESQIEEYGAEGWQRIEEAIRWLHSPAVERKIVGIGLATWSGLRTPPGEPGHVSLEKAIAAIGQEEREARPLAVQLPLNLAMPEAIAAPTQELEGVCVPLVVAAAKLGAVVFSSASILQGRLARGLPPEIGEAFPGLSSDAQRALQFSRSAPGVTTALAGMSSVAHVNENLGLAATEPAGPEAFQRLFSGPG
jgi:aryl-alcohol dehydrogenase-like predicted oxidoreductase